jgi:hypothetical protein
MFKINVMGEYKKTTIADINLPEYCIFFLKKILSDIEKKEMVGGDVTNVFIATPNKEHPYCYEAVDLICRTLKRKNLDVMIPSFKKDEVNGETIVTYKWKVKKLLNVDDLPF